jgi:hypothetical protein
MNKLVGERGFEPPTPWSRTRCSTRLSHSPNLACGSVCRGRGLARYTPLHAFPSVTEHGEAWHASNTFSRHPHRSACRRSPSWSSQRTSCSSKRANCHPPRLSKHWQRNFIDRRPEAWRRSQQYGMAEQPEHTGRATGRCPGNLSP